MLKFNASFLASAEILTLDEQSDERNDNQISHSLTKLSRA